MKTVIKPWGKEEWLELNDKYCYKRIYLNAGFRTSYQYHQYKKETNYIISGKAEIWLENDEGIVEKKLMEAGEFFNVTPPKKHRVIALTDVILQEVSTPEVDDVLRIEDDTNRNDGRIEEEHLAQSSTLSSTDFSFNSPSSPSINKDTKVFGSFSSKPGNNGCHFFNSNFQSNNIDAIYKSFYGVNAKEVFNAAKTLNFSGFALSMPLKEDIIPYLDQLDIHAQAIGAVNTVILQDNKYVGYNTDWLGVKRYMQNLDLKGLSIIGTGGFSKAIQYYCKVVGLNYEVFTRNNIDKIGEALYTTFNATPADIDCDIDGRPSSSTGKLIAKYQALEQYKLYVRN